jgi:hypothetical protein
VEKAGLARKQSVAPGGSLKRFEERRRAQATAVAVRMSAGSMPASTLEAAPGWPPPRQPVVSRRPLPAVPHCLRAALSVASSARTSTPLTTRAEPKTVTFFSAHSVRDPAPVVVHASFAHHTAARRGAG